MSTTATYVYCVVRAARRPSPSRTARGVPEGTRPAIAPLAASLWFVTSQVPLDVYGSPALDARLRDLDWVSETAVAHEAVVEHFAASRAATVIPMTLFTMFSSLERAVEDVLGRRAALQRVFERIGGAEEWGIRVTRAASAAAATRQNRSRRARPSAPSGTAFLAAQRDAREASRQARADASACAERAFDRLARVAREAARRERRPEPGTNPPILEAAFLVPVTARARFRAEARRQAAACAGTGAQIALTGPWPAYNFVRTEGE
jgi:hypothetical protein